MEQRTESLTNLQRELLKMFSYNLSDEDLRALKKELSAFFANRTKNSAAKIWKEKNYTQEDMDKWLNDENQ